MHESSREVVVVLLRYNLVRYIVTKPNCSLVWHRLKDFFVNTNHFNPNEADLNCWESSFRFLSLPEYAS